MTLNNIKTITNNLDDFIDVPNGIDRLRTAMLSLAASGKLVPQDPKEESAEKFYNKIKIDRKNSEDGATGRKRKIHNFLPLTPEEIPYEIPSSWKWVRLGEIVEFRIGKTPPRKEPQYWSNAKIPWVSIADLNDGGEVISTKENINKLALDKVFGGYIAPKGTLLFSFKLTIGKMSILGVDACHNEAIAAFFPLNDTLRDYLFNILPAVNMTGRTANAIKGKTLNSETIALIEVPLPPLAEQKRIVQKIEELMKQLDDLEIKKQKSDETRTRFARSAMQTLGRGESKIAFENLIEIIRRPEDIKELENALLSLAFSGKLIPQDKKDGTAEELYSQIQIEKIKNGVKHKIKDIIKIKAEEIPFEIPKSWKWVNLLDVYASVASSDKIKTTEIKTEGEWPVIDQGEKFISGYISTVKPIIIDTPVVVFGDHTLNVKLVDFNFVAGADGTKILKPILCDSKWLYFLIKYFKPKSRGYSRHFKYLNEKIIPLSPIAEQKRIVKKVEEIMALINQLRDVIVGSKSQGRGRPKK